MTIYFTGTTDLNITGFDAIQSFCGTFLVNTCGWTAGAVTTATSSIGSGAIAAGTQYRKYTAPSNIYSIYLADTPNQIEIIIEPAGKPMHNMATSGRGILTLHSIIVGEDYIIFFSNLYQGGAIGNYYISYLGRLKPLSTIINALDTWGAMGIGFHSFSLIGNVWQASGNGLGDEFNPYLGLGSNPVVGRTVFTDVILSNPNSDICLGKLKGCYNGAKSSQNFSVVNIKNGITESNAKTFVIYPFADNINNSSIAVQIS